LIDYRTGFEISIICDVCVSASDYPSHGWERSHCVAASFQL